MVRIWSEYDESMGHFQAYDTQLSCFLVFSSCFLHLSDLSGTISR